MPSTLLFLVLLVSLTFSSSALAIYKCESGGQTVYSDTPCHHGKTERMQEIAVTAPATDAALAQKQAQQDKQELQRLQQQRHKQEKMDARQQEKRNKASAAKKQKCAESAQRVKWASEDAASASGKTAERARQKARRATEKHQLTCGQT
ncbi:DUF4124 domain-containing protein [Herminiimonas fonticola]|uniref:DUF4124 domain-containing protein n=1 Tax=Herminiimonas fonticola TaxID=303380 RepID=UPI0033409D0D